jgi:hypothetical protein
MDLADAELVVEVRRMAAGPTLVVNGNPTAPTMLFVNLGDMGDPRAAVQLDEIRLAARHGVDLVSLTIGLPWPRQGQPPDFAAGVDRWMDAALAANPRALLLPRIATTWPPEWWMQEHPDDVMLYDDGKRQTASVHSRIWRQDAARHLSALVAHLEQKYGDHVLGYHPSGQHTGEWFYDRMWEGQLASFEPAARDAFRLWLRSAYGTDEALRRAWRDAAVTLGTAQVPTATERDAATQGLFRHPNTDRRLIDFLRFQNEEMADAALAMCAAVKAAAPRKLAVVFYGYHFEVAPAPHGLASSGHVAFDRVLASPAVDVICSPVSYFDRGAGGGGYFMAPVESVALHDKLWLVEDDTRTHLAPADAGYGRLADARQTAGVLTRNFAHLMTRGMAVWWMDLMGEGWYHDEGIWDLLGRLRQAYAADMATFQPGAPEIAVIVDDRSALVGAPSPTVSAPLLHQFRREWYRIGAPVGTYLLDDLVAGRVPAARMYLFTGTFRLDAEQIRAIRRRACRPGNVVVWMYAAGIVQDDDLGVHHVAEATGMPVTLASRGSGEIALEGAGVRYDAGHPGLAPALTVSDERAEVLARYVPDGTVAVAASTVDGCTRVCSGVLQLPAELLRQLARQAGAHIYEDQGDVVMAGNGFVAVHASAAGAKTLRMPARCALTEVVTGESFAADQVFRFPMEQGDTRLFRVTPATADR